MTKNLTEQWKNGELEEYKKYYCKTKWFEDIFQARCYNKGTEDEWWTLENERYRYNNAYHTKDIEVLVLAPSYEELQNMNEAVNQAMGANIKLVEQNKQLKELLKECREIFNRTAYTYKFDMVAKIDEVLI